MDADEDGDEPVLDGGSIVVTGGAAVPVERLRALIRLLYPDEMTPIAKRMIESVIEEHTRQR